jgi:uncharacterized integral membrane protein
MNDATPVRMRLTAGQEWGLAFITLIVLGGLLVTALSTFRLAQLASDEHRLTCSVLDSRSIAYEAVCK